MQDARDPTRDYVWELVVKTELRSETDPTQVIATPGQVVATAHAAMGQKFSGKWVKQWLCVDILRSQEYLYEDEEDQKI